MKIRFLLFTAVLGATVLVACGKKGLSPETQKSITAFETDWKSTGEAIKGWEATLNTGITDIKGMIEQSMATGGEQPKDAKKKADPAMQVTMDSLNAVCTDILSKAEELRATFASTLSRWSADEKAYSDWKAGSKDLKEEQVVSGIGDYTAKLAAFKTEMENWNTTLSALQSECKGTCDMISAHMGM